MLELDTPLPEGALVDAPAGALAHDLAASGALWWDGTGLETDARTGAVTGWAPRLGIRKALPTDPNTGNGLVGEAGDLTGLQCRAETHCGLVLEDIAALAITVTLGLRYLPPHGADARTLATYNTGGAARKGDGENYLFVSEADGALTIKDDKGLVELTLPTPSADAPRMVLVSLSGAQLRAEILGGASGSAKARTPVLSGSASLFIGCRNQRPGLLKTLGGALISDVWLWPGRDVLGTEPDALRALRRFHLWSEDA